MGMACADRIQPCPRRSSGRSSHSSRWRVNLAVYARAAAANPYFGLQDPPPRLLVTDSVASFRDAAYSRWSRRLGVTHEVWSGTSLFRREHQQARWDSRQLLGSGPRTTGERLDDPACRNRSLWPGVRNSRLFDAWSLHHRLAAVDEADIAHYYRTARPARHPSPGPRSPQ